jgi:S-disulfanyl-L-cysteine oxidoreductase SoxD
MRFGKLSFVLLFALVVSIGVYAQDRTYNELGRTPTSEEIEDWDIAIGPAGEELPPGSGTAKVGAKIFAVKCVGCHGQNLEGSPNGKALVGGQGTLGTLNPKKTIGAYWPFATSIWDFINRAMPPNLYNLPIPPEQRLKAEEVYALTAFILYRNDIIQENDVIDANTLPKVEMPNRNGFVPAKLEDALDYRGRGCRAGTCP